MLRIRVERRRKGWRLEDLAHFARVSAADISRIETGRMKPYPSHLSRLSVALELDPTELLQEVGSSSNSQD